MKKLYTILQLFTLFTAGVVHATAPVEKHPVDNFQIGIGSSSSQKQLIFDLGLGSSNPNLGVDTSISSLNYNKNTFTLGDGNSSQKSVVANVGSGATNPKIIWDSTNSTWAFSNDGTNFSSFGSGSGGASGIQLLTNGDFESGITLGWTNTGGTFASVSSGSNLLVGKKSATFTASASGQSVQSSLYTIPNGLTNQACAASMMYKGGDVGLTFEAVDGSGNILASQVIQTSTQAQVISLPFQCPSSGTVGLKIVSGAPAALIALDQMFLGQNTLIAISQANYYGGVIIQNNCNYLGNVSSGTYSPLSDSGTCTGSTTVGNVSSFVSSNGNVTFNNLPPGEYQAKFIGACGRTGSTGNNDVFHITDGTSNGIDALVGANVTAALGMPCILERHFSYQVAGNHTFSFLASSTNTSPESVSFGAPYEGGEFFSLYRFPSQSEIAVRPETINWTVEGQISGVQIGLGITPAGLGQFVQDPSNSLVMTSYGSIPALKPCVGSGVAPAPGAGGCGGAGAPVAGVAFTPPATGKIEVCAEWNVAAQSGVSSTNIYDSAYFVMTPANDDTVTLQTGVNVSTFSNVDPSSSELHGGRQHICEMFNLNSTSPVAFRIYNNAVVSGATATRNEFQTQGTAGSTQSTAYVTVRPLTQNVPAPVLTFQPVAFRVGDAPSGPNPGGSIAVAIWGGLGLFGFDTNNGYSTSTGYYTVPVGGLWHFDCSLTMNQTAATNYQYDVYLVKAGGAGIFSNGQVFYDGSSTSSVTRIVKTSNDILVSTGDQIYCAGSLNISGTWSGDYSTNYFEGHLIR
jgi:hypothetical protein